MGEGECSYPSLQRLGCIKAEVRSQSLFQVSRMGCKDFTPHRLPPRELDWKESWESRHGCAELCSPLQTLPLRPPTAVLLTFWGQVWWCRSQRWGGLGAGVHTSAGILLAKLSLGTLGAHIPPWLPVQLASGLMSKQVASALSLCSFL